MSTFWKICQLAMAVWKDRWQVAKDLLDWWVKASEYGLIAGSVAVSLGFALFYLGFYLPAWLLSTTAMACAAIPLTVTRLDHSREAYKQGSSWSGLSVARVSTAVIINGCLWLQSFTSGESTDKVVFATSGMITSSCIAYLVVMYVINEKRWQIYITILAFFAVVYAMTSAKVELRFNLVLDGPMAYGSMRFDLDPSEVALVATVVSITVMLIAQIYKNIKEGRKYLKKLEPQSLLFASFTLVLHSYVLAHEGDMEHSWYAFCFGAVQGPLAAIWLLIYYVVGIKEEPDKG